MGDPIIRPARRADFEAMLAIRYTDPEPEVRTIAGNVERARKLGRLLAGYGVELLPERTSILEIDGDAVALMEVWLPGDGVRLTPWKMVRIMARGSFIGGPGLLLRYRKHARLRARVDTPRPQDSLYIAHLDTHPDHRGKGYGKLLLHHAEAMARKARLPRLSLDVYTTNPARRLYARQGYRVTAERVDAEFEKVAGVPGYAQMVKKL